MKPSLMNRRCGTQLFHQALVVAAFALAGCGAQNGRVESDAADARGLAPAAEMVPFQAGGRSWIERRDGHKIPLLTLEEMRDMTGKRDGDDASAPKPEMISSESGLYDLPPPSYDLSAYQTPIKNQLDRGTCGSFGTVAAIEAAYKRTYGVELDLSEQYMFHVSKSTTVNYPRIFRYENQSSYWSGGGWPSVALTYRLPAESDAPYAGIDSCPTENPGCAKLSSIPGASLLVWHPDPALNLVTQQQVDDFEYSPLHVPMAARRNAKYGITSYSEYSASQAQDTSLLESIISSNKEVIITVNLKWRWRADGVLDYDPGAAGGWHVFLLIGYNRAADYFLVKNSWGGTAPSGYLKVSYNFLRNASASAATIGSIVPPSSAPQGKAKWMGKWHQDHDGWRGVLVVRRLTAPSNAAVRFGTYYLYGSYESGHSANGYSIDGNAGVRFYVASEAENPPGTLTGQLFEADLYQMNPDHAAGAVFDPGGEGGVHLGRNYLGMPYSNTFSVSEWVGTWDLNTNGTPGVLTISSVSGGGTSDYVVGATLLEGGVYKAVNGTVERLRPTIAHLNVSYGSVTNLRTLHHHFWENGLASGFVTATGAVRTGAHAVKR